MKIASLPLPLRTLLPLFTLLVVALAACAPPADGRAADLPIGGKADAPADPSDPDTLSVWSWNLENFPHAADAPERVAQILEDEFADVVGLQEIDDTDGLDDLLDALPNWGGFPGRPGFGTQVAIAYRRDRLRVVDIEDLFEDDSSAFPRPPMAVTFELRQLPHLGQLTIVIVHLKAQIDSKSEQRRRDGVAKLEQWIYERRLEGRGSVLAIGDWNDELGDARANNVFLPFLDRARNYDPLTEPLDEEGEFSYIPFRRLIDHVISTREASEAFPSIGVEALDLESTIAGYERDISDHRPVRSLHHLQ